jgi:cytochrome bd-type quinol oxidase subunit 2
VLGLPLFAFLFLAGWDLGLLFTQLGNLADHYREASAIRRIAFSQDLQGVFLATSLGVLLARAPRFLKRLETALAPAAPRETDNG